MDEQHTLRAEVEHTAAQYKSKELLRVSRQITERYRDESGKGRRLVTSEKEVLVYAAVRMPATYGAVRSALGYAFERCELNPSTLLDVGAGTGAASWAAASLLNMRSVICVEREAEMLALGRKLMVGNGVLRKTQWLQEDINDAEFTEAELVIAAYALNELGEKDRRRLVHKLWSAASQLLIIVEPGTPEGFRQLRLARELLLEQGAYIVAPCPHQGVCPMEEGDWCHFTCRVERGKLHKQLKGGDAPYEDEKFAYIAVSRTEPLKEQGARVLRHPLVKEGRINLELCTNDGIESIVMRKKDENYKAARKAKCGDWL